MNQSAKVKCARNHESSRLNLRLQFYQNYIKGSFSKFYVQRPLLTQSEQQSQNPSTYPKKKSRTITKAETNKKNSDNVCPCIQICSANQLGHELSLYACTTGNKNTEERMTICLKILIDKIKLLFVTFYLAGNVVGQPVKTFVKPLT